jgi:hypothetical protein
MQAEAISDRKKEGLTGGHNLRSSCQMALLRVRVPFWFQISRDQGRHQDVLISSMWNSISLLARVWVENL